VASSLRLGVLTGIIKKGVSMSQWHCAINGKKYGPVSEEDLKQWITQHRLDSSDMVWTEGMAEWLAAGSVSTFSDALDAAGPVASKPVEATQDRPVPLPMGGTGGASSPAEITQKARETLRGRWGLAIGFSLLLILISMVINMVTQFVPGGGIVSWLVQGPLQLGGVIFYLHYTRRGKPTLDMLFVGFRYFGKALAVYFLMMLFVFLWMLLLIIPGIIASYAYSQAWYLLTNDPSLGAMEAIRRSKAMMQGHKWRLFCLYIRFIGWSLLCLLTFGIGYLWLIPYMWTSMACFHNDLLPPKEETVLE
jgi:uncharacterized membrane protein